MSTKNNLLFIGDKMTLHTFHDELKGVSDGSTNFDQKTEKYPDNLSMCLQHICVVNQDKNNSRANIGVITGQQIMWLGHIVCSSDQIYYDKAYNVFFKSARNIIVRWNNTSSGDKVEAYVYGYYRN